MERYVASCSGKTYAEQRVAKTHTRRAWVFAYQPILLNDFPVVSKRIPEVLHLVLPQLNRVMPETLFELQGVGRFLDILMVTARDSYRAYF